MSRHMDFVRVQPCILNSALFQCISEALPCTLMHCISDSTCYATLHHPLHLHLCTCHPCLFVCLFVCFLCPGCICCLCAGMLFRCPKYVRLSILEHQFLRPFL